MWYRNIGSIFFSFCHKAQTDRKHYDSQDRANIAASRSKTKTIITPMHFTDFFLSVFLAKSYSSDIWEQHTMFYIFHTPWPGINQSINQ